MWIIQNPDLTANRKMEILNQLDHWNPSDPLNIREHLRENENAIKLFSIFLYDI